MAFSHLRGKQRFGCDRRRFVFFQPLRYSFPMFLLLVTESTQLGIETDVGQKA